jgi:hypothetical protein
VASNGTGAAVLILALARGASYDEAAKAAGVGERTVVRRMRDPAFRTEVERVRTALLEVAMGRLAATVSAAVDALEDLLSPGTVPTVRRGAADAILGHALRLREHLELDGRLTALEARLDAKEKTHGLRAS